MNRDLRRRSPVGKTLLFIAFILGWVGIYSVNVLAQRTIELPSRLVIEGHGSRDRLAASVAWINALSADERSVLFTDLRAMASQAPATEFNLGIGHRRRIGTESSGFGDTWLGAYAYLDQRNQFDALWRQATVGVERIGGGWEFRANGYIPLGGAKTFEEDDDQILLQGIVLVYEDAVIERAQRAMGGFDIELGRWIAPPISAARAVELGIFGRAYRFAAPGFDAKQGVELWAESRSLWRENAQLRLALGLRNDSYDGSSVIGRLGFEIPFGPGAAPGDLGGGAHAHMMSPPRRDLDVVVGVSEKRDVKGETTPVNPSSGGAVGRVWFVTAAGTGDGSREDPTNLDEVRDNGAPNDVIVILGDDGTISTGGSFVLKEGQALISPGGGVWLADGAGGTAYFAPTGIRGTLTNIASDLVRLASHSTVSGLRLIDAAEDAIDGSDLVGTIRVTNNRIEGPFESGIDIDILSDGAALVDVSGNTIQGAGAYGIGVDIDDAIDVEVAVTGNLVQDVREEGIAVHVNASGAANIALTGNYLQDVGKNYGIPAIDILGEAGDSATINVSDNAVVGDVLFNSIRLDWWNPDAASDITISGNELGNSLVMWSRSGDDGRITVRGNTIRGNVVIDRTSAGANTVEVADNRLISAWSGIQVWWDVVGDANETEILVNRNVVDSATVSGIVLYSPEESGGGSTRIEVTDNDIGVVNFGDGIVLSLGGLHGPSDVTIAGNTIEFSGSGSGIFVEEWYAHDGSAMRIADNAVGGAFGGPYGDFGYGIFAQWFDVGPSELQITGNDLEGWTSSGGIFVTWLLFEGTEGKSAATITDNFVDQSLEHGISVGVMAESGREASVGISGNRVIRSVMSGIDIMTWGDVDTEIADNVVDRAEWSGISQFHIEGDAKTVIKGNVIGTAGEGISIEAGIWGDDSVFPEPLSRMSALIHDNQIGSAALAGIFLSANNDGEMIAKLSGNVIGQANPPVLSTGGGWMSCEMEDGMCP